jgi:hypothetical protein
LKKILPVGQVEASTAVSKPEFQPSIPQEHSQIPTGQVYQLVETAMPLIQEQRDQLVVACPNIGMANLVPRVEIQFVVV